MLDGHKDFIAKVDHELGLLGISRDDVAMIDHLCYRTETMEQYESVKSDFSKADSNLRIFTNAQGVWMGSALRRSTCTQAG